MSEDKIPVVDVHNLYNIPFNPEDELNVKISQEFGNALHVYGFAYLKNHGIPDDMISEAMRESKKFFNLSPDVKNKYLKGDIVKNYHGYATNMEKLHDDVSKEFKETFDMHRNNRFYPEEEVPEFQKALETLEKACRDLDLKLIKLLAMSVKLDVNVICNATKNLINSSIPSLNTFRTLYYPMIPDDMEITDGVVRCGSHTDYGVISLLFQDDVGGLEVKGTNGWIHAEPIPGTIVVNTGDLLEAWTGKYFPATEHRVFIPKEEKLKKTFRQSMAFFLHPDDDVIIQPLNSEILTNQLDAFEPITAYEHAMGKAKKAFNYS